MHPFWGVHRSAVRSAGILAVTHCAPRLPADTLLLARVPSGTPADHSIERLREELAVPVDPRRLPQGERWFAGKHLHKQDSAQCRDRFPARAFSPLAHLPDSDCFVNHTGRKAQYAESQEGREARSR